MTHVTVTPEMPRVNLCRGAETPNIVLPAEEDLIFEEKLLHSPYDVKLWLAYLYSKKTAPVSTRLLLFERAVHILPGSYKVKSLCHNFRK